MDTNFQTSFIPKKPLAEERVVAPRHTSLFSFIATLIFFGALAGAGAMYFYEASLQKSVVDEQKSLDAARNVFEPSTITEFKNLDRRLTDANQLLSQHVAVSPIFAALQANTLKSIQFTKFTYTTESDPAAPVTVHMSGKARDYASIALESDQLATNKNIHNSIFSNLVLDPNTGLVGFDLVFTVDPDLVRFTSHLEDYASQQGTDVPSVAPTTNTPTTPASGTPTNTQ